jgi:hypothetical protein
LETPAEIHIELVDAIEIVQYEISHGGLSVWTHDAWWVIELHAQAQLLQAIALPYKSPPVPSLKTAIEKKQTITVPK